MLNSYGATLTFIEENCKVRSLKSLSKNALWKENWMFGKHVDEIEAEIDNLNIARELKDYLKKERLFIYKNCKTCTLNDLKFDLSLFNQLVDKVYNTVTAIMLDIVIDINRIEL